MASIRIFHIFIMFKIFHFVAFCQFVNKLSMRRHCLYTSNSSLCLQYDNHIQLFYHSCIGVDYCLLKIFKVTFVNKTCNFLHQIRLTFYYLMKLFPCSSCPAYSNKWINSCKDYIGHFFIFFSCNFHFLQKKFV